MLSQLWTPMQTISPGQLLTANSVGMSPSGHLLRYAAGRDAPATPLPYNGTYSRMPDSDLPILCLQISRLW